jgi:hypothetical protein
MAPRTRRRKREYQTTVAVLGFGGYGGHKSKVMDSQKVSKFVTKNAPRLVLRDRQEPVRNFDEMELEQPVFEHNQHIPLSPDDETLEVCEPYRSAASEREGVARNWRDTEEMSAKILRGCDAPICGCQRRDQVKVCDFQVLLHRTSCW